MEEYKSEFLNEIAGGGADFTDEELAGIKQFVERRDRATAPAAAAPMENAPTPSTSIGMFMPSTVLELRGRENLGTSEGFNDRGGRGYDDFVPGEVTKTAPSGDEIT